MGYTHYWKRVAKFDKEQCEKVVRDCRIALKHLSEFVPLAGGLGKGEPEINNKRIWFNGVQNCGHNGVKHNELA